MKHAAHIADKHICPQTSPIPHVGGPIVPAAWAPVEAEALQAARLADYAGCAGPLDVVFEGAATVLVRGLPFAGLGDHTAHQGVITTAAGTVTVGGPTFSLPPNFIVKGDAAFQNALIRDLFFLSTLPSGRALIDRLARAGQPITFVPEATPDNSFCSPSSGIAAGAGIPTGSTISYNPNVGVVGYDDNRGTPTRNPDGTTTWTNPNGSTVNEPPQSVLAHEMVHGLNNAEGNHHSGNDPMPPLTQDGTPDGNQPIEEEEAAAIGTGSHSGDYPTENSVRSDMGLPRRDNHFGAATTAPTGNQRPGGY
jgi:uncharacterized Zn-binding protein involved in type VI secretion